MFLPGSSAAKLRTALTAAALAAVSPVLGQAATPAISAMTAPATPPDSLVRDVTPVSPAPAPTTPPLPAPPTGAKAAEAAGPVKPAINQAIRDALSREASARDASAAQRQPEMRALRQAVDAYYASRGDAPVWVVDGKWTAAARAAFDRLQLAPDDGLDLRAYRVYALGQGPDASLALGDVALSEAVAAYALQASGGRIQPARISRLIGVHPPIVSAAQALAETSGSAEADKTLRSYNPQHPGYLALREKLAEVRAAPAPMARLAATERGRRLNDAEPGIGARRNMDLENEILTNMEFWRWLPRDLGAERVMVNIPEFTGRLYRDDALVLPFRVITGKPDKQTPLFSDKIEYMIVNPSWNVPQSIIKNELMPHLDALRAQGYEIRTVNGRLTVRQPPGERNALGQIKFIFPNDYAVYMHDTPTRNLFSTSRRAYSHGCVRVDQPFKLAEDLLGRDHGWSEERLRKMVGKNERRVALPQPVPVHIVYFTLSVDENGRIQRFDDIYGYSRKARDLLGLGG